MNKKRGISMEKKAVTVKEFAELIGVSRQTVYKWLSTGDSKGDNWLTGYATKGDKGVYIDIRAVDAYKGVNGRQSRDSKATDKATSKATAEKTVENDYIETLKQQIEEKDKQIKELSRLLDQQQQLSLHLQSKIDVLELEAPKAENQENKKTWWQRVMNRP